jgi:hypothetical protein
MVLEVQALSELYGVTEEITQQLIQEMFNYEFTTTRTKTR